MTSRIRIFLTGLLTLLTAALLALASVAAKSAQTTGTAGYFSGSSLRNIAVDAGTNSLSQTAFYGGSLKDNLGNSLQSGLINESTGFAQNFVGDIKGSDGSPIGVIGHGIVGCISVDVSGGNCGRGAVNAAAGEIATAWADKAYGQDRDKVKELIRDKVNPTLAALTSGGDLGQFSINQGITASQLQNNYLTQHEKNKFGEEMLACDGNRACEKSVQDKIAEAWATRQQKNLIECRTNPAGCEEILSGMQDDLAILLENYDPTGSVLNIEDSNIEVLLSNERTLLEALQYDGTITSEQQKRLMILRSDGLLEIAGAIGGGAGLKGSKLSGKGGNGARVPRAIGADIPSVPVHNINEFFNTLTGGVFKSASSRTSKTFQGQRVYKADIDITLQDGSKIRKGDQFYLDGLHKNHLEVFDARGRPKIKVDLAGKNLGDLPSDRKLP